MTVATIWINGSKYEGYGKGNNEALASLKLGWAQRCELSPEGKEPDYLTKHADDIKYSE
jgi:hypothetical protein